MTVVQNTFRNSDGQPIGNECCIVVDHCTQSWLIDVLVNVTAEDLKQTLQEKWEVTRITEIVPGEFGVNTRSLNPIFENEIVRLLQQQLGWNFNSAHEKVRNFFVS